jgi:hypothetical protein
MLLAIGAIGCSGQQPAPSSSDTMSSLRDIVTSGALVGRRVRVTGRCAAPARAHLLGLPSRVQATWQLEADGVAVFVTGPRPPECSVPNEMAEVTISALVAEDTLPAIGDLPPSPRRYLVQIRIEGPAHSR